MPPSGYFGTTKVPTALQLTKWLIQFLTKLFSPLQLEVNASIALVLKGGKREEKADALSKSIDIDDWGISFAFFNFVDNMWGVHTIHRFANMNNTKLPRYNSIPKHL
jgi:hypothetical protein